MQTPDRRDPLVGDMRRRRELGIYYTPPAAAEAVARWAIQQKSDVVLEPSFGGCAMLSAAMRVLESHGVVDPSPQLFGFDVDSAAFEHLARLGLNNKLDHFKQQDFLRSTPVPNSVDAVIANPPFVSYHRQSSKQRTLGESLRARYLPALPRLASLWVHFLLHSMQYLKVGGRMAFVLPNAIGSADYAKPVLEHMRVKFSEIYLIQVSERLFIQSGTDERVSLLLLSGYQPENSNLISDIKIIDVPALKDLISLVESGLSVSQNALSLRESAKAALAEVRGLIYIGDIATVRIGEVVGDVKFFVKSGIEWESIGIKTSDLFPIATRASQLDGLKTKKNDVAGRKLFLFLPSRPLSYHARKYLKTYPEEARETNKTFKKRPAWYECSYDNSADAFIGSMNHAYPRVIVNAYPISVSNAFYKISLHAMHEFRPWLAILSLTTPFRLAAEIYGRVRGSGGIKLEPSDVKRLVLPSRLPELALADFSRIHQRIDQLVSKLDLDAANQLADHIIYIKPKLLDASMIATLRMHRMRLTQFRLRTLN
jgi:adenine-specific DNA-methyltransferase